MVLVTIGPRARARLRQLSWGLATACTAAAGTPLGPERLAAQEPDLLLRRVTVVSAERAEPLKDASVLIENGRIAWIGNGAPPTRSGVRELDLGGRFLIPGLIDGHVHIGHLPISDDEAESHPDLVRSYHNQVPRSLLYFGFTTVVDPDLRASTRARWEALSAVPSVVSCGRGIRHYDGYGPALFPNAARLRLFPIWTFDDAQRATIPDSVDLERHTPEALVARLTAEGAQCIKTYHESGFGGAFAWPTPAADLLARIGRAARVHRLPLMLHATGLDGYEAGLAAGVDLIAHGLWHWPGPRLDTIPSQAVERVIRELSQRQIAVQPTLRVIEGEYDTWTWQLIDHPGLPDVLPPVWIAWARTDSGRRAQRDLHALYAKLIPADTTPAVHYLEVFRARVRTMMRRYRTAGIPLLFGTDTPAADGIGNPPGLNGYLEIQGWAAAGIPPLEIFDALTRRNATAFGLGHEIGTVEIGKRADLLIVDRDPRRDASAYDTIRAVILGGRLIDRNTLSARWTRTAR